MTTLPLVSSFINSAPSVNTYAISIIALLISELKLELELPLEIELEIELESSYKN